MKKYKLLFNENEVNMIDAMLRHCLMKKVRFANRQGFNEICTTMEDVILKLDHAIEVDG
jgi:hypothetical protein